MENETVKTAIIDDIVKINPWDGPKGRVWYYDLILSNGEKGSIGKKSDDALVVGQKFTYTAEMTDRGTFRFKEYREFNPQGGRPSQTSGPAQPIAQAVQTPQNAQNWQGGGSRNASFALSYAKDVVCAAIAAGEFRNTPFKDICSEMFHLADLNLDWLDRK